ncbi:hypothetical protein B0T22DRAFT_524092 [Podospora appendiculata]|uniref:Peptidase C1A papain C-terminal domain-containing protein n=1 Tax=Podospora appendiculata TaxID=314037 RepID=A0AAE0WZC7_9PEZI|nr:hypothetical protein B0T22DRAFT_524092 [Podospora appendiculata]
MILFRSILFPALLVAPACSFAASPKPNARRWAPWGDGIPVPALAASIGPIDWSSISPSPYSAPRVLHNAAKYPGTATSSIAADSPLPAAVDWRNRNNMNYITTAQNQGACQSCWAFAVTALVEAMVRIEHGIWSKRSEADVHDGVGAACESFGNAEDTLGFVAGQGAEFLNSGGDTPHGIADWPCDPYEATLHGYTPCADRSGRATHIPFYQALGVVEDQKRWLHEYGPLIATFILYSDFQSWKSANAIDVYSWDGEAGSTGNHIALIVGYDDARQAWIIKNSWGPGWGQGGFVYFSYCTANIDGWTKYGLTNVNPDPWARKRHQSGNMMQTGNGETHRDFELFVSSNSTSNTEFAHISRDGQTAGWSLTSSFQSNSSSDGSAHRNVSRLTGQPVVIGTSFGRDFHVVGVDESRNLNHWAYNQSNTTWRQASAIDGEDIDGYPGLVQSDDSSLLVVVRHADGTLREWQHAPRSESESSTWTLRSTIADGETIRVAQSGPTLVQSNVGFDIYDPKASSRGNLYVVAVRTDGTMQLFWRTGNNDTTSSWTPAEVFGSGIPTDTPPVMIQDYFNTANESSIGGFQLAVAVNGSVQHWRRENNDLHLGSPVVGTQGRWLMVEETAAAEVKHVWSLVQGSFSQKMHMITEGSGGKMSYWEWDGKWARVETLLALGDSAWPRSERVSSRG